MDILVLLLPNADQASADPVDAEFLGCNAATLRVRDFVNRNCRKFCNRHIPRVEIDPPSFFVGERFHWPAVIPTLAWNGLRPRGQLDAEGEEPRNKATDKLSHMPGGPPRPEPGLGSCIRLAWYAHTSVSLDSGIRPTTC
jgi:hypothetical protein